MRPGYGIAGLNGIIIKAADEKYGYAAGKMHTKGKSGKT
jgi:hypothetical protein